MREIEIRCERWGERERDKTTGKEGGRERTIANKREAALWWCVNPTHHPTDV